MAFQPLHVRLPGSQFSRTLFFRRHITKGDQAEGASLFVGNLPPHCTEEFIRGVFGEAVATVEIGFFDNTDVTYAMVSFQNDKAVEKALTKANTTVGVVNPTKNLGMQRWEAEFEATRPNTSKLTNDATTFIANFSKEEAQAKKEATKQPTTDGDGFTLVTRKTTGNTKKVSAPGGTSVPVASSRIRKRSKVALVDFYRFQQRQQRREHIAHLRAKFEQDKARIAELRAQRKFKPF